MNERIASYAHIILALFLSPLLSGVVNRVKAKFGGRTGQPLLQAYYDLFKLLRKGAVYSRTTTLVFRLGPVASLGAALAVLPFLPIGGVRAFAEFAGDFLLALYLLGIIRFVTVLAALDTGSAFEGMGASREVRFSALAEPAMLLGFAALAVLSGGRSLSGIYAAHASRTLLVAGGAAFPLVAAAFFLILLAENARIPVDDPNTHLELTMIHEVMVLDHGGVDLGLIQYASGLKLWIFCALWCGVALPVRFGNPWADLGFGFGGVFAAAIIVGVVESAMARLKMTRVPQMLLAANVLCIVALALVMR